MLTRWLSPSKNTTSTHKLSRLNCELLETRENPAVTIQFDYRFDNGFFTNANDPQAAARRAILEQAGRDIGSRIDTPLAALQPSGNNSWTATVFNPSNPGQMISLANLKVPANTIIVFASGGGRSGNEAGLGGYGGYSASGSNAWLDTLRSRGPGFSLWGGSVSFDPTTNWNTSGNPPASNQLDLYSVSVHELFHVFGFGTAPSWNSRISNGVFVGQNTAAVYGSAPAVSLTDPGHWRQGLLYNGQVSIMQPALSYGERHTLSNLDFAALADMGWRVNGINSTPTPAPAPAAVTSPPAVSPPPAPASTVTTTPTATNPILSGGAVVKPFAVSTPSSVQMFNGVGGTINPVTGSFDPFPGFGGMIRTATGDVTGDGVADLIVAAGPGGGPHVKVFNGQTGALVTAFFAYEPWFTGGVFVAAGDFNNDGRADIVVGADTGGGPRVRVFNGANLGVTLTDFYGIDDPNFRGGVRVAAGDLNGDGTDDLIVGAGFGGAPRVALYDGRTLSMWAPPTRLTGDFYGFEMNLTNGSYVAAGDLDGDGFDDLILGAGEGGGPRIKALSGRLLTQQGPAAALNSPLKDYFTGNPMSGSGVRVAAADVDGDGKAEIVATSGINSQARVFINGLYWGVSSDLIGGQILRNGVFVG
jgi:hypothetical protein